MREYNVLQDGKRLALGRETTMKWDGCGLGWSVCCVEKPTPCSGQTRDMPNPREKENS